MYSFSIFTRLPLSQNAHADVVTAVQSYNHGVECPQYKPAAFKVKAFRQLLPFVIIHLLLRLFILSLSLSLAHSLSVSRSLSLCLSLSLFFSLSLSLSRSLPHTVTDCNCLHTMTSLGPTKKELPYLYSSSFGLPSPSILFLRVIIAKLSSINVVALNKDLTADPNKGHSCCVAYVCVTVSAFQIHYLETWEGFELYLWSISHLWCWTIVHETKAQLQGWNGCITSTSPLSIPALARLRTWREFFLQSWTRLRAECFKECRRKMTVVHVHTKARRPPAVSWITNHRHLLGSLLKNKHTGSSRTNTR